MHRAEFLAVIYADGSEQAALSLAERHEPASIASLRLAEGGLLLCRWDGEAVPRQGVVAVVDGTGGAPEISLPDCADTALAPASVRGGLAQLRSYVWLDDRKRLAIWTDHMGVSPVYMASLPGMRVFSADYRALAALAPEVDDRMVASFLVNGHMLLDRTLHIGISSLPLASHVVARPDGIEARPYWQFRPGVDAAPGQRPDRELEDALWQRVTAATLASTAGRHVVLPLSGGHDSSCIAGILAAAGHPVSAFSFVTGEPKPGSDADIGRRQAQALGIPHRLYRMDQTDCMSLLRTNIGSGMYLRTFCQEIETYARAADDAKSGHTAPMFVFGDQGFGQRSYRLDSDEDLLGAGGLKTPSMLDAYDRVLAAPRAAALKQAMADTYAELIRTLKALPGSNEEHKDWLYYASVLASDLVHMRTRCGTPFLPFAVPYLEMATLDFMRRVPAAGRRDRRLFKQAAERHLPRVFSIPRSTTRQSALDLPAMLARDRNPLLALVGQLEMERAGLSFHPGLADMLASASAPARERRGMRRQAEDAFRWLARRRVVPERWLEPLKRRAWNKYEQVPDQSSLLLRAMQLAMVLDGMPSPATPREPAPRGGA